jgi:hypothetical protein
MDQRAGSLRAVVAVGGDVDFTHGVGFGAGWDAWPNGRGVPLLLKTGGFRHGSGS